MGFSLLLLGIVAGLRHALEADHVAAVAYFTTRNPNLRQAVWHGAMWGLGHSITLLLFGAVVLLVDGVVPERYAAGLEFVVGLMLIALGVDLLRRLVKERVHFHAHRHGNDVVHFHAHSHAGEGEHKQSAHDHTHVSGLARRALYVGLVHGMAGSAALIIITLQTVTSIWTGIAYIALFGFGSIVGMALLSVVIAVPLRYSARKVTGLYNALQLSVATLTVFIGGWIVVERAQFLVSY